MIKYANIVFMQGDDYDTAIDEVRRTVVAETGCDADMVWSGTREWCDALYAYLLQWDSGDAVSDEVFDDGIPASELSGGSELYDDGRYAIEYDTSYGYCGLRRAYTPETDD